MNEEKINKLNMLEQNLRQMMQQKQNMQAQLLELESAIAELSDKETFKLVGNILVKKDPKKLKEEMTKDKALTEDSMKQLQTQEDQVKTKAEALRKEIMEEMKKK